MQSNFENNKRIAKNTFILYGRMLYVLFVSIYTTRVLLGALGVEDYGIYNVGCGFVSMFTFLNTSMSNGIQRFYNFEVGKGTRDDVTKVYQTSLLIQIILALAVFLLVEGVGIWFVNFKMVLPAERIIAANWIFQLSTISLVLLILQVPYSAAIMAHERMDYYAIVSIIDAVLKLLVVIVLPYLSADKLILYGIFQLSISLLNLLLYFIYSKRQFRELVFKKGFHKDLFKSIFTFSGWNVLSMFAWMTQGQGVNMVVNLFFGPIINAARGVSGQIQSAVQGFCENLVIAFRPQLVQSYAQGNLSRTTRMMYSMSKIMFIMFFCLSTPIILEIDYILKLWLGENIPDYTAPFTVLVLLSMYPRNFSLAFAQVVHATGRLGLYQVVTAVTILLALPFSYLALMMGCDALSVYWVNLIVCVIMFFACIVTLKKVYPIDYREYFKQVIMPCTFLFISTPIIPFIITQLFEPSFLRLCLTGIVSVGLTLALSYMAVLDKDEKNLVKKILIKRK